MRLMINRLLLPAVLGCIVAGGVAEHNAVIERLADELDVPFHDVAAEMPRELEYWAEGRHNNERGAQAKAEIVAGAIEPLLP